ncbi:arsenate reductase ArsC [bacterium]|nr:arsenate reductase ArsC [bacterium]
MARAKADPPNHRQSILFLCTGNSCRSQMAEGWGRFLMGESFDFYSAGVLKKGLNPKAVKAMQEAGVDISSQTSKLIAELPIQTFDFVISLCENAGENCPFHPSKVKMVHHPFDDPPAMEKPEASEEENLKNYRRVRDEIREFVKGIPGNLK